MPAVLLSLNHWCQHRRAVCKVLKNNTSNFRICTAAIDVYVRSNWCVFTVSHVVDAVQVALAFLIVHVLASGTHDLDRVMAEEDLTGRPAEELMLVRGFGEEIHSQNFNIFQYWWGNNINWIIKLLSEDTRVRTLFEGIQVAGSATFRQSRT